MSETNEGVGIQFTEAESRALLTLHLEVVKHAGHEFLPWEAFWSAGEKLACISNGAVPPPFTAEETEYLFAISVLLMNAAPEVYEVSAFKSACSKVARLHALFLQAKAA